MQVCFLIPDILHFNDGLFDLSQHIQLAAAFEHLFDLIEAAVLGYAHSNNLADLFVKDVVKDILLLFGCSFLHHLFILRIDLI